jgi:teichuronic acid exporter
MHNMESDLKRQTISGMTWSAVERFGYTFIMFISNLVLARLLTPDDFGLVGMITVFIAISATFVDSGFASALIQKKDTNIEDYSTAFYINIVLSIIFFIILSFSAPAIAGFYHQPPLVDLLRVAGLVLVLNAFNIVQSAKLRKELKFKLLSQVSILSAIIGCSIGIIVAFCRFGVWSLVIQTLSIGLSKSILLWILTHWKPQLMLSKQSFKKLFGFGSMVLLTSLMDTISTNLIALIIGRFFPPKTLGQYTQARTLEGVPNQTLVNVVNQVTFPIYSQLQNDHMKMKVGVRKSLKSLIYINFPLMVLLIIIAGPLFRLLYTDKWIGAVPYFQIACIGGMLLCLHQVNQSIMLAIGKSNIRFWAGIVKRIVELSLIILGIHFGGMLGMLLLGVALSSYLSFLINAFFVSKIFPYTMSEQIKDILPTFLLAVFIGIITYYLFKMLNANYLIIMSLQIVLYGSLYITLSKIFKFEAFVIYSNEGNILLKRFKIK